jgi:hypothetical protein
MGRKETLKLAIITNSCKSRHNREYGRCVAGVASTGEWVRLVSDISGDSIPVNEAKRIPICTVIQAKIERAPLKYQTENAVLSEFSVTQEDAKQYIQNIRSVNETGIFGSTSNQLEVSEMRCVKGTLRLIDAEDLKIYWNYKNKCKTEFDCGGNHYDLPMTDPNQYTKKGSPLKSIGKAYVVVSLSNDPPFNKFAAAIYPHK